LKVVSYYHGQRIPYLLGILIGLDIFLGSLWPGAHVQRTISERLGRKRVRIALRKNLIYPSDVYLPSGAMMEFDQTSETTRRILSRTRIPFSRHPLAAVIDRWLDKIDRNHTLEAIRLEARG